MMHFDHFDMVSRVAQVKWKSNGTQVAGSMARYFAKTQGIIKARSCASNPIYRDEKTDRSTDRSRQRNRNGRRPRRNASVSFCLVRMHVDAGGHA